MKNLPLVTAGVGETDKTVMTSEQLAIKACLFFVFVRFLFFGVKQRRQLWRPNKLHLIKVYPFFSCFCFVLYFGVKHLTHWLSLARLDWLILQFSSSHVKFDVYMGLNIVLKVCSIFQFPRKRFKYDWINNRRWRAKEFITKCFL